MLQSHLRQIVLTSHADMTHTMYFFNRIVYAAQHSLLENDAGAIGDQEEVGEAMYNHRALALLDDIREYGECWREARIPLRENRRHVTGAHRPVDVGRCVNCLLDICSIEVHWRDLSLKGRSSGKVMPWSATRNVKPRDLREPQDIP